MTRIASLLACVLLFSTTYAGDHARSGIDYIENLGQWEKQVLYKADLYGGWVFLEKNTMTYLFMETNKVLHPHQGNAHKYIEVDGQKVLNPAYKEDNTPRVIKGHAYKQHWLNANPLVAVSANEEQPYYFNYFIGNDPARWKSNALAYKAIQYSNLYPNIDLKVYSEGTSMKSDYIIRKAGKVADIRWKYDGVDGISIEQDGKLKLTTSINEIYEFKPYAYQVINGKEVEIACLFKLKNGIMSFDLPNGYNEAFDLVIDPTLVFSTYSGSFADNWGSSATHDNAGNMFLGGIALASDFPTTTGAFQTTFGSGTGGQFTDVVITKFTSNGSSRLYSTYLGGNANEVLSSLYCTPENELIILTSTSSTNFPTSANGYDKSFNSGNGTSILEGSIAFSNGSDVAITKLNVNGTALVGSTFFGGSGNEGLNQANGLLFNYGDESRGDIAVDAAGNIFIVSNTNSSNIPGTSGKAQASNAGGYDGFVAKFNSSLSSLDWSTYFGGSSNDAAYSIQLDNSNNILICGGTTSNNLPSTSNGLNSTYRGGEADGFVAKVAANGNSFVGATYIGTSSYDQAYIMDLDKNNNVYLFGQTLGAYPVTQGVYSNAGSRQFLHKLNNNLNTTTYSTVFGRTNYSFVNISPTALLVDVCENIYAVGWGGNVNTDFQSDAGTTSNMPVTQDAFDNTTDGSDFYLISLSRDATNLVYATYFGENGGVGDHVDGGTSRFDKNGIVYQAVCASCGSSNGFPTTQGAYSNNNLSDNCNMAGVKFRFDLLAMQIVTTSANPTTGCAPFTTSFSYTSTRPGTSWEWDFGDGGTSTAEFPSHTFNNPGTYTVKFILRNPQDCNPIDSSTLTITVLDKKTTQLDRTICEGESVTVGNETFREEGTYTVTLRSTQGCDSIVTLNLTVNPDKRVELTESICEGENFTVGNQSFSEEGTFIVNLTSSQGCDSIVTLNLTLNPNKTTDLREEICEGESVTIGNQTFDEEGEYSVTLTTSLGCDSIVNLTLIVNPEVTTTIDQAICTGSSYTIGNQTFNQEGSFTVILQTTEGCDSTINLNLTVTDSIVVNLEQTICVGGRVVIGNEVFDETGDYTVFLQAVAGCDSTVNLSLSVVDSFIVPISEEICEGGSVTIGNETFDEEGDYSITLQSTQGCDSIIKLSLIVNENTVTDLTESICEGESFTIGNQTFDEEGEYTVVLSTSKGCDSTVNLVLTILDKPEIAATVDETPVNPGTQVQLSVITQAEVESYSWSPPEEVSNAEIANPTATVEESTWFYVTVTDRNGCTSIDSVFVEVQQPEGCEDFNIFLPSAFTPNGDGQNDVYRVKSVIPLESMTLMIFNRWGEKVFETNDQSISWDGTYKGKPAAADAYGYYFEGICNGTTFKKQGNITIVR